MTKFLPYGPFELDFVDGRIALTARKAFRADLNSKKARLAEAVGCYVFSIKGGKSELPWYVGKTEKMNFVRECAYEFVNLCPRGI